MIDQENLEEQLNSFDARERKDALKKLAVECGNTLPREGSNVNMHFHSFFSYNAEGYSPSRIAWEARKAGLYAAGLCDFDVLDGLDEFMKAGLTLGLRATVNIETRAYVKEYADVDINSPGEHGVTYIMGAAFTQKPAEGSLQAKGLNDFRQRARLRNISLIKRINSKLTDIATDYEKDVLPLTPSGSATERHIITAYINKSKSVFKQPEKVAGFWAKILGINFEETTLLLADLPALEEAVRSKLAKRGGIGYEPPSVDTFPPVGEFLKWVASCEAIPMATWLDGTSGGEKNGRAMLECMQSKGAAAVNLIPDRNWNISSPEVRAVKTKNLKDIVEIADIMNLPVNIGTEMNKLGLPFMDNLDCEALRPFKETFLKGARIMVGHSLLQGYAGFSYIGDKANSEFKDVKAKNSFFEASGKLPAMTLKQSIKLQDMGKEKAFAWFNDAVNKIRRNK